MSNPVIKTIKKDEWRKIASNVVYCSIHLIDENQNAVFTYRTAGDLTAIDNDEGIRITNKSVKLKSDLNIDVYVMALNDNGKIRVDSTGLMIIDELSNVPIGIDYNHHEIHKGQHYFYSGFITLGNAATGNFTLLSTKDVHFVFSIFSDIAGFTFATYENVTANNDGTLIDIRNNNRDLNIASSSVLRYNPTNVSTAGATLLRSNRLGAGGNPSSRVAGSVTRADEVILKADIKYLLTITNLSTDNNYLNIGMSWYEK